MIIDGPFNIKLGEDPDTMGYELEIQFKPSFNTMPVEEQCDAFSKYIDQLKNQLSGVDAGSTDSQGMGTILKFAESIFPYIESGEAMLDDPILIEIRPDDPIANFLKSSTLSNDPVH